MCDVQTTTPVVSMQGVFIGINQGVTTVKKATNIQVQSKHSSFKTSLFCLIVPKVTENLPLVSFDVKRLNLLNNIRFADPQFHVSGPIDLLMGNFGI
jgi:hypothetical protein